MKGRYLTEAEYLLLGADRCRLTADQRKVAYEAYRLYEIYRTDHEYWDISDRMFSSAVVIQEVFEECECVFGYWFVRVECVRCIGVASQMLSYRTAASNAFSIQYHSEIRY